MWGLGEWGLNRVGTKCGRDWISGGTKCEWGLSMCELSIVGAWNDYCIQSFCLVNRLVLKVESTALELWNQSGCVPG